MKWSAGYSCSVSIKPTVVSPKEEYEASLQDSSCKGGCDRFVCEDLRSSHKLKRGVQDDRSLSVDPPSITTFFRSSPVEASRMDASEENCRIHRKRNPHRKEQTESDSSGAKAGRNPYLSG